ncbi:hypothetical protein BsWGS_10624 [Bradybaena similaris]
MNVFDRKAKRLHRERTASGFNGEDAAVFDYVKEEFGYRLSDRICDIKRRFEVAVDLGCGRGHVTKGLYSDMVGSVYQCELSPSLLRHAEKSPEVPTYKVVVDEEFLPFKESSIDIVISNLSLHWVNDLPGCLRQILQALKSDGVLIGNMFGGDTLHELRVSLQLAEVEREGGFAPHVSPFTTVNDLGNLLTRAGFTMLTIDIDELRVNYPSMIHLMYDLKGMAENNCSWARKSHMHRDTLLAAAAVYQEMYGNETGVPATFQVINFIGWKPDPSQPKAAKRGSGQVSLKDIDKIDLLTKKIQELRESKGDITLPDDKEQQPELSQNGGKQQDPEDGTSGHSRKG